MYKETDIFYEHGDFFVLREKNAYTVYRNGITHAISDSSYELNDAGLSIAVTRVDYLAKRNRT